MKIKRLRVDLIPMPNDLDLEIRVEVSGSNYKNKVTTIECCNKDDFVSFFDSMFDRIRYQIKEHLGYKK